MKEFTKDCIKRWIQKEYIAMKIFKRCDHKISIKDSIDGCQGVIDFVGYCQPEWKDEIFSWWYEEMLPNFVKLEKEK